MKKQKNYIKYNKEKVEDDDKNFQNRVFWDIDDMEPLTDLSSDYRKWIWYIKEF